MCAVLLGMSQESVASQGLPGVPRGLGTYSEDGNLVQASGEDTVAGTQVVTVPSSHYPPHGLLALRGNFQAGARRLGQEGLGSQFRN